MLITITSGNVLAKNKITVRVEWCKFERAVLPCHRDTIPFKGKFLPFNLHIGW